MSGAFRYDVAFSLAGEQAADVEPIADELRRRGHAVFFYGWKEVQESLPSISFNHELERIYGEQSRLVVPVLSGPYARKPWTGVVEARVVTEMIHDRRDAQLLLLRADDERVPGFTKQDRHYDLREEDPFDIADAIEARLIQLGAAAPDRDAAAQAPRISGLVPALPPGHVVRAAALAELQRALTDLDGPTPPLATALVGMGGVGKTTLAQAICQPEHRPARFEDAVWIPVERESIDLTAGIRRAASSLRAKARDYDDPTLVTTRFAELLRRRRILVVLDDVWDIKHLRPFLVEGTVSHVVFTTRIDWTGYGLRIGKVVIGSMDAGEGLQLLRTFAGREDADDVKVVERLGGHPLALRLAGSQLQRDRMTTAAWLQTFEISRLRVGHGQANKDTDLVACLDLSRDRLSAGDRSRYDDLAIFPSQVRVPERTILKLWTQSSKNFGEREGELLLDRLEDLALIDRARGGGVTLHHVLRDYARDKLGDEWGKAHRRLLRGYGASSDQRLPKSADRYYRRYSTYHFGAAGLGARGALFDQRDFPGWASLIFFWRPRQVPIERPRSLEPSPLPDHARIALMGNWATGLYGAPVIAETLRVQPAFDLALHLGDVYRFGRPKEVKQHFIDLWPFEPPTISRSLNGNHDMYSGGKGYFEVLLPALKQPTSYFSFANSHWLLIALDTAYVDDDLDGQQREWLAATLAQARGRRVVVFSHHYLFSMVDRRLSRKLVAAVGPLLARHPVAAWYWSHDMNAVIYEPSAAHGGLWARSAGHGGAPVVRRRSITSLPAEKPGERIGWRLFPESASHPAGRILDGPNDHKPRDAEEYAPHGYVVLTLAGPRLQEQFYLPEGEKVWEWEI